MSRLDLPIKTSQTKEIEAKLIKANHLYSFISNINRTISKVKIETYLLNEVCKIAVQKGDFKMAWVGILDEETNFVKLVSSYGVSIKLKRILQDKNYTQNSTTQPLLNGIDYQVINNISEKKEIAWPNHNYKVGLNSAIKLAIKKKNKTIGCFYIYSKEYNFFDKAEITMLMEAANDISFCLDNIELAKQHEVAESIIMQSEQRFRLLTEKSADMVTISTKKGDILYASSSVTKILGYSNSEIIQTKLSGIINPDDLKVFIFKRRKLVKIEGASFTNECRLLHKNGNWVWCEVMVTNYLLEPSIKGIVTNFRDISVRKEQELKIKFDSNNLTALINNSTDLLWSVDTNFNLITCNLPYERILQKELGVNIKKGDHILLPFLPKKILNQYKNWYKRALNGEYFTEIFYTPAPQVNWIEISFHPIKEGKNIVGTACHSRDITERKIAELDKTKVTQDLIQRNRDLEQFTFIVSHNLRGPVVNILGISNILNTEFLDPEELKKFISSLCMSANSLDNVLKDLNTILQVKNDINEKKEQISFSTLVNEISVSIAQLLEKDNVTIIQNFTAINEIYSLRAFVYSIFYNLIINSVKYAQPNLPAKIEIKSEYKNGKTVLTFKDNGLGIDLNKNSNKVFGLYNRFHRHLEGKGMGMFMTKTQVEALGGTIAIESEPLKGTLITIKI
ncbi:PAS domain S-box protein [Sediminibacterium sp.]|uniref:PAS domain S-box protein n=1 Tax=Sediminibacterium sp. TaxID=1917865 RepID=UPI002736186F|nr:PAS domain S-box protein [Sediminibacterium sp.]MDP3394242.1 PAS domain S-box protein [Sediminibacterium sp.]MDP3567068.1 PAS domain S-box protein [Sediminibacterium sp.]